MTTHDIIKTSFFDLYEHTTQNLYSQKLFARLRQKDFEWMDLLLSRMTTYDEYEMNRALFRTGVQAAKTKNSPIVCELLLKIFILNQK